MNPYPALTGTGWCRDPELAISHILSDYLTCEVNKTKLYRNRIRSLPYQLMRYTTPSEVASVMTDDLVYIYKNHFDSAECTVEYLEDEQGDLPQESPRYRLAISLIIFDGTTRYSLGNVISIQDKTVVNVVRLR